MSSRHLVASAHGRTLAALAVRLNLAKEGRFKLVGDLVSDAETILSATLDARVAQARGRSAKGAYAKADRIAQKYGAFVLERECGNTAPIVLMFSVGDAGCVYPVL